MATVLEELEEIVQEGEIAEVKELVQQALDEGISAQKILDEGLLKGMSELGVLFKNNEVFVPDVLMAAKALNAGTEILKVKMMEEGIESIGKVVIATVAGDMHDIGKNLVRMMMEGAGFEMIDLGIDVPTPKIVEAVKEHQPDIVALSALLTTTMEKQREVVNALVEAGLRDNVKIMVGGAPITEEFCADIGADKYTQDAAAAAEAAKAIVAA
ncbi:MAG: corrinoid protein [Clostridiales Family XIII bacterium]|jgi:5-methyltetrahydrofolate--homocysteine methyltransferase|nr:corrinoid protein [Clostridiales Family XIII bacterium]